MSNKPPTRRAARSFRDLRAWQEAFTLAVDVHAAADALPTHHTDLADQLRRASTSVHLTIAEGNGKSTVAEFARYLDMAHGSLHEAEAGLHFARASALLPTEMLDGMEKRIRHVERLMAGLRRYLARRLG